MRNIGIESLDRRDLMAANILSDALVPPTQPANHRMFAIIDRTPLTEPTSNTVYMASAGGGVWKTTNGGYAGSHALYQDIAIPQ